MAFPRTNTKTLVDSDTNAASTTTHNKIGVAGNERRWRVRKLLASYGTLTQVGSVSIAGVAGSDGVTPVTVTFNFTGSLDLDFGPDGLQCAPFTDLVVTLSAGAAAVVSNLTTIAFPE